jgi:cytochrome P450
VRAQRAVSRAGKWSWEEATVINIVVRKPDAKERIQKELDDAKRKGLLSYPFPTYDECVALPYLQATATESMRLHSSTGTVLERVVHRGGPVFEGFYLPAGTKVGCHPRVIHRDEDVYGPDVGSFNPDRFLGGGAEERREMEARSMRCGGGTKK